MNIGTVNKERRVILSVIEEAEKPLSIKEITEAIKSVDPKATYDVVRQRLFQMKGSGLVVSVDGVYSIPLMQVDNPLDIKSVIRSSIIVTGNNSDFLSTLVLTKYLSDKGLDIGESERSAVMRVARAMRDLGFTNSRKNNTRGERGYRGLVIKSPGEEHVTIKKTEKQPKDAGLMALINLVLDEREKREPSHAMLRSAVSGWLDLLIKAREGNNLEATVDRVIEEMMEVVF